MAEMGKYCKAYMVQDLRKFSDWAENLENLRQPESEGNEVEPRTTLKDDDILYLQENYTVTDGIFKDEHIIFDQVTDQWKDFCTSDLESPFVIPVYEPIEIEADS